MGKKYKVIIDGYGGDNAPLEIVKGAVKAVNNIDNLTVLITGKEAELKSILSTFSYDKSRIVVVPADDVILNDESPTLAIRTKKNSSMVVALDMLKNSTDIDGLVSAGSSGALLTGAFLKIGRIEGISRPALAPVLPTRTGGKVMLTDCGANMDAKPINLCHFAIMASKYMELMYNEKNPRVGLLSVGVENEKGNALTKSTFPYMQKLPINFVGNMEARDFLSGNYDIVISDGFSGNVLLKGTEGAVMLTMSVLKREIKSTFLSKLGALFLLPTFKKLKTTLDYSTFGGSAFLGINKIVIKSHGSSKEESIYQSIMQIITLTDRNLINELAKSLKNVQLDIKDDSTNA